MQLTSLQCRGFRGLADIHFEPGPGLNVLRGANAQGKTSVLEALLYAATARSHRTASDQEIVRHGADAFHIIAEAQAVERAVRIEAHWWRGAKRFKINGLAQTRLSDILGRLCVVFFSPEDIALVKGAAASRRLFLDMELSQLQPAYLRALQQYRQAMRQRNELLRRDQADSDMLSAWEAQLDEHGKTLMRERAAYIATLSKLAAEYYARVVADEPLHLIYRPDIADPDAIAATLCRARKTDLIRKSTGRGPHRDDVEILIAEKPARAFGSQGQQKSAALIIKLAEVELMRGRMGEYPLVLLDEALAELDGERSQRLLDALPEPAQAIITTAQPGQLPDLSHRATHMFFIERGALEKIAT